MSTEPRARRIIVGQVCERCAEQFDASARRKICFRCSEKEVGYVPTLEEIAATCAELQKGWDSDTKQKRRVIKGDMPVDIPRVSQFVVP